MKSRLRYVSCVFALCGALWPAAAGAHHSFSGIFDVSKEATLKGRISKIEWVNPHIYLYIDVVDQQGKTTTWGLETLPPGWMRKAGITKADFLNGPQLGETVIVAVHPSRDPAKTLGFILHITYPDGHILKFYEDPNGAN